MVTQVGELGKGNVSEAQEGELKGNDRVVNVLQLNDPIKFEFISKTVIGNSTVLVGLGDIHDRRGSIFLFYGLLSKSMTIKFFFFRAQRCVGPRNENAYNLKE